MNGARQGAVAEKLLPQNVEAEAGVLGSILIDAGMMIEVNALLRAEMFYREVHREQYEVAADLYAAGVPADYLTWRDELLRRGKADAAQALDGLAQQVPTSRNAVHYARIVERTWLLRGLVYAAGQIAAVGYNETDADAALDQSERLIAAVSGGRKGSGGPRPIGDGLGQWFTTLALLKDRDEHVTGVPSGYPDLDRLTSGWQRDDLVLIAGRPSMGKTSYALGLAYNAAKEGHGVVIFSLEMSEEQLLTRLVAMVACVDGQRLRAGFITDEEYERVTDAVGRLSDLPLAIDDAAGLTVGELCARAKRLMRTAPYDLLIVDYLQLLQPNEATSGTGGGGGFGKGGERARYQVVGDLAKDMKRLAKDLHLPVLALAQLSRAVEARGDKRPQMSDLSESGQLEMHADLIQFLYREEAYNPQTDRKHVLDVLTAKHRNGPVGDISLWCQLEYSRLLPLVHTTLGLQPGSALGGLLGREDDNNGTGTPAA